MSPPVSELTRVTIVAGFLGSGKTSVIRHLLANDHTGDSTAVLVNEVGAIGVDGACIGEAGTNEQLEVRELAGGCICCTAQVAFRQTVVTLLRKRPRRLIVEPTGLAAVGSVLAVFAEPGIAPVVELDPTLVVIDPRHWDQERIRQHPLYLEQCAHADVIAVSHTDCCDPDLLDRFQAAHSTTPQITASHGALAADWHTHATPAGTAAHQAFGQHAPSVKGFRREIITWTAESAMTVDQLRQVWDQHPPPPSLLRCKGILNTDDGWLAVQLADGQLQAEATTAAEQASLVLIFLDDEASQTWWQQVAPLVSELSPQR